MISSNLASFPVLLENITWIRNFSLADGQLVGQSRVSQSGFGKLIKDSWALNVFICYFRFPSHLSNILYERVSAKRGSTVGL